MVEEGSKDAASAANGVGVEELASSSNPVHNEVAVSTIEKQDEASDKNKNQEKAKYSVPFYKLFSFADSKDVILMILGSLGAIGNGISLPLMTIFFGNLIQSFGDASTSHDVISEVSKVSLHCYLSFNVMRNNMN